MTEIGSFWIAFSWKQLLTFITVEYNTITASGGGEEHNVTIGGSESRVNVTDLMPGTTYQLNVVAISENSQMSVPSITVTAFTLLSGKCKYDYFECAFIVQILVSFYRNSYTSKKPSSDRCQLFLDTLHMESKPYGCKYHQVHNSDQQRR